MKYLALILLAPSFLAWAGENTVLSLEQYFKQSVKSGFIVCELGRPDCFISADFDEEFQSFDVPAHFKKPYNVRIHDVLVRQRPDGSVDMYAKVEWNVGRSSRLKIRKRGESQVVRGRQMYDADNRPYFFLYDLDPSDAPAKMNAEKYAWLQRVLLRKMPKMAVFTYDP